MTINMEPNTVCQDSPRLTIYPGKRFEDRFREICAANGMSLTDGVKEAIRCYVVLHDKPLEPKR